MTEPVYIVTGAPRTGTSMLMQMCWAGGMTLAYDKVRDQLIAEHSDDEYQVNPESLFEIGFDRYAEPLFPLVYRGKVIKVFWWGLEHLHPHVDRKMVLIERDPEERRQSFNAAMVTGHALYDAPHLITNAEYVAKMQWVKDTFNPLVLQYAEVVAHPGRAVRALIDAGWPISFTRAAASVVNPDLYRFRNDGVTLTPGM